MLKIVQWNIRGYINNYNDIDLIIRDIHPDIICLQETKIPINLKNHIVPKSFIGYFTNSPHNNSSKEGAAILVKRNIPHKFITHSNTIQSIQIQINIPSPITLISAYIPPTQNLIEADIFSILPRSHGPLIFLGDFNAWSPLWGSNKSNARGTIIENIIMSKNLTILNDGSPTHFSTHNSFTHIDLTLVSSQLTPKCNWKRIDDLYGSDHFPLLTEVRSNLLPTNLIKSPKFNTDAANWNRYQSLCEENFKCWSTTNINKLTANITKAIRSAANIAIPQSNTTSIRNYSAWWNSDLHAQRIKKQRLWHAYKLSPSLVLLISYKKANAQFKKSVKEAKRKALSNFTSDINPSSTPKKIWAKIKALTGIPPPPLNLIQLPNCSLTAASDIANAFGNTWSKYAENSSFPIDYTNRKISILSRQYRPLNVSKDATCLETKFSYVELESALQHAKGKTPGRDRISYPMLRNLPKSAKNALLSLYNKILNDGIYPHSWLSASVLPIPKPNKPPELINSYRPISLLSCLAKILEKMLTQRLMWLISKNTLVSHNQVAFKRKHGVLDCLLPLQHFITDALSSKNHVTILSTDFEKAFDRIGAHVVLEQLSTWCIGPKVYNLIKSFLTGRKFQVKVNGEFSHPFSLENGIPQGSPLSVVLFSIAFEKLNKIASKFKSINFRIYADDAIFYTKSKDPSTVERNFINLIYDINAWGQYSGTTLTYSKCKVLHICRKHNCPRVNLSVNNSPIENVANLKILGVIFDDKYTFKPHCSTLRTNLFTRLNIIKYLASKHLRIHQNTLITITRSLVLSKIDFCLPIYGWCAKQHLNLLNAPYHSAVRRSLNAFPTSPIKCVLAEAGLPSITERCQKTTLKLITKFVSTTNKLLFSKFKTASRHNRSFKIWSVIRRCIYNCNKLGISLPASCSKISSQCPWKLLPASINVDLHALSKINTNAVVFIQRFMEIIHSQSFKGWVTIFTDGSRTDHSTTFAVVENDGSLISNGWLTPNSSIFSAEALAILQASEYATNNKGKFLICTDSLSVCLAIKNIFNDNQIVSRIRDKLIKYPNKIKILWIPSHIGIPGNVKADAAAKNTYSKPSITFDTFSSNDILKTINLHSLHLKKVEWSHFNHPYALINPECKKSLFPTSLSKHQITTFIRLRLGHTKLTHEHLLLGSPSRTCQFCGGHLSIEHILDLCPTLTTKRTTAFGTMLPSTLLNNVTFDNVIKIYKYMKCINISDHI